MGHRDERNKGESSSAHVGGGPCLRIFARDIYAVQQALLLLGDEWFFRGQKDASYELDPSCERESRAPLFGDQILMHQKDCFVQEQANLDVFKCHFRSLFYKRCEPKTLLGWMSLMQHYGMPTRMLDFSTNRYVALYFASEPCQRATACSIWAVNRNVLREIRISEGNNDNRAFSEFMAKPIEERLSLYGEWKDKIAIIEDLSPEEVSSNWRIFAQDGLFLVPAFFSTVCRSILSESIVSKSPFSKITRCDGLKSVMCCDGQPFERMLEFAIARGKLEIVIPAALKPLMREWSNTEGVCQETICPDSKMVDTSLVRGKMKTDKINKSLSYLYPWL